MRKIFLFMHVSLDGYYEGPDHDISWFNSGPDHFDPFSMDLSQTVDTILFGRRTFELMQSYWPTAYAIESQPEIAMFMNDTLKVVASRGGFEPGWQNTRVTGPDAAGAVRQLKSQPGKTLIVLGSNALCTCLAQAGLIDEFQVLVNPVVLGAGSSLFTGLGEKVELALRGVQQFKSGQVLLTYQPVGSAPVDA